jgi:heme oxygenase
MTTISQLMRESSLSDHKSAENAGFIKQLMGGELSAADYTRYLNQMIFVYQAMEAKLPDVGAVPFAPELKRFDSMVSDLKSLGVEHWHETEMLPATREYVARVSSIGGIEDVRLLAHHYTRYLGDLSGGQAIGVLVRRHYGLTEEQTRFYLFAKIKAVVPFKENYRAAVDNLEITDEELLVLVAEVRAAFKLNQQLFIELGDSELIAA